MTSNSTAVVLIGYQNDYFASDGILRGVIEEVDRVNHVLNDHRREKFQDFLSGIY